ncbi:hypothetical protein XENOCAPTIV_021877 [Xenoophorus captivus]|uniref:Uncharacterized protein n=1 Tax=Xenoophorus captivus TaxID=1517983 RepID=A0ABV0RBL6_9TELE
MRLPSSYLHFGPIQTQNVIEGTSQYQDQADKSKELKKWATQQDEELRRMYGEEVEIVSSPMLLQEMEEAEGRQPTPVTPVSIPGRIRSSLPPTVSATPASSRRRRPHRKRSTPATAAPAELNLPTAALPEPSTSAAAPAEPSSPAAAPAAAEFPAGFGSRPGLRRHRGTVAIGEVRIGASNPSMEGPSAMASSQLLSPELVGGQPAPSAGHQSPVQPPALNWVQAMLKKMKEDLMERRCCNFVLHLMDHPEDLNLVHSVLQAEFIAEGWLDAPAPLSAGGPFDPLLVAVRAAQSSKDFEPQPSAAKPLDSQPAAKLHEPQPATAAGSTEPRLIREEPVGGLPPQPGCSGSHQMARRRTTEGR